MSAIRRRGQFAANADREQGSMMRTEKDTMLAWLLHLHGRRLRQEPPPRRGADQSLRAEPLVGATVMSRPTDDRAGRRRGPQGAGLPFRAPLVCDERAATYERASDEHGRNIAAELIPKGIELICELVPQAGVIALLVNQNSANAANVIRHAQEAARAKGVQLAVLNAGTEREVDAAFASLVQLQAGALVVDPDGFFNSRRQQLLALASRHAVPTVYPRRQFVAAGGLSAMGQSKQLSLGRPVFTLEGF
jgi:hypothetical protein